MLAKSPQHLGPPDQQQEEHGNGSEAEIPPSSPPPPSPPEQNVILPDSETDRAAATLEALNAEEALNAATEEEDEEEEEPPSAGTSPDKLFIHEEASETEGNSSASNTTLHLSGADDTPEQPEEEGREGDKSPQEKDDAVGYTLQLGCGYASDGQGYLVVTNNDNYTYSEEGKTHSVKPPVSSDELSACSNSDYWDQIQVKSTYCSRLWFLSIANMSC